MLFKKFVVIACKAHYTHRGTGVEGELFDVNSAVGEGHQKEIRHIESECDIDENFARLALCFIGFIFAQEQGGNNHSSCNDNVEKVRETKKLEYFSACFVGQKLV